ncbi:MAG: OmpA family protein [Lentisphaeraceae bacterium]|nr:OmpA family protein [Lentisphaeraceae bacterium]
MSKKQLAAITLLCTAIFTSCTTPPRIYNPNASHGRIEPSTLNPGQTGPLIEEGGISNLIEEEGGFIDESSAIPGEGRGTPVNHPFTNSPVYFAYDSAVVGAAFDPVIQQLAQYLNSNPSYYLTVNGHSDERGSEEYNRALSEKRALAVKSELTAQGIPEGRINTVGYGEETPAATGNNADAYAKNRRAEFEVFSR